MGNVTVTFRTRFGHILCNILAVTAPFCRGGAPVVGAPRRAPARALCFVLAPASSYLSYYRRLFPGRRAVRLAPPTLKLSLRSAPLCRASSLRSQCSLRLPSLP